MSSFYETILNFVETHNINILNLIFIGLTAVIVICGSLVTFVGKYLPASIRQWYRYGKSNFEDSSNAIISKMEMPKSWFKHFYVFAFVWSVLVLCLILRGFILKDAAPEIFLRFLDLMAGGRQRPVRINFTRALVAGVLVAIQCTRRFYESNFIQIFSKKSRMNVIHYLTGYIHYFGVVVAVVANSEGFVRGTLPSDVSFSQILHFQYVCIFVFLLCWFMQYKSNIILINLRKDSVTGEIVAAEKHLIPHGGFFELVSSPHMFFEIVMYMMIWSLLYESITMIYINTWVISNQVSMAILAHQWYKQTFDDYPKDRRAIIPFII